MKIIICMIAISLILTAAAWCQEGAADRKALEGSWTPSAAELGGQALPEEALRTMKLTIKGDKYHVKVGEAVDQGTFKIDPAMKPKTMDIIGKEGPNKDKTFLAIYEVKGDTLRVCYDLTGKARPTEFKTKQGALLFLATYKRDTVQ